VTGEERLMQLRARADAADATAGDLRRAAVAAVVAGLPKARVARAAGISRVTLDRWLDAPA
jgi:transposase